MVPWAIRIKIGEILEEEIAALAFVSLLTFLVAFASEAFASGLYVVSTKVGGIPYLVKDGQTGFLVNSNDYK
jgi:glycosyltransferase involved in cell wall biosynthesis